MPSMVCQITKDISRPTTFLVRMYATVKDIGIRIPIDAWECHLILVDEPTRDYINDLEIVKTYRERSNENGKVDSEIYPLGSE